MRDFKKSEFKKVVGITLEDYDFIDKIRHKKSTKPIKKNKPHEFAFHRFKKLPQI